MSKIELGKQYRTRDGREARIYAVDGQAHAPIHGATKEMRGWVVREWAEDGQYLDVRSDYDLIEVRPRIKRTLWVNILPGDSFAAYHSRDLADSYQIRHRKACVPIEIDYEEGEGL
jgi:hypothetical protein